jgi:alanine racemase
MTPPPPELAGAVLTIDLDALHINYKTLARKAGKASCGAAVKANGYGHGLGPVSKTLWTAGCRDFFVARPAEGAELRRFLPDATIYVLDGLFPGQAAYYAVNELRPALIAVEQAREWAAFTRQYGQPLPCALHVDTGINRMGLSLAEFHALTSDSTLIQNLHFTLLMSHLACADDPGHTLNQTQQKRFKEVRAKLPDVPASLSNSSGIFLDKSFGNDLVRPGVSLYGGNPVAAGKNPMKPVAHLHGTIMQVRDVKKGGTVGYSATWKAPRDSRIAILGAGYADGIPRTLSSTQDNGPAQVWLGGKRCPIIGRVSMDMMGVDVTDLRPELAERGLQAEIIGKHIPIDEVAAWAGTISYEIMTRLGSRYARVYKQAES